MSKRPDHTNQKANTMMIRRTLILMVVCGIVAFVALAARLYHVMIVKHDYYESLAVEQQTKETSVTASRGTIYDTNGKVLAMSASADTVYISPYEIRKYNEDLGLIARTLSQILGVEEASIYEKAADTESWYKTIKTKIDEEPAQQIRAFIEENNLMGVHLEPDSKRFYPYSSLACHVIGFVGDENKGLEGLEASYDEYLTGENGRIVRLTNAAGTDMLLDDFEYYFDAMDGYDTTLTLDVTIQHIAENYLQKAIDDYEVKDGGACIVMDPKTGAILGMASMGNYDLNHYLELDPEVQAEIDKLKDDKAKQDAYYEALYRQWRNKCINDTYEPGSVFKILTMSMALEEGTVGLDSTFYCDGSIRVIGDEDERHCWATYGHGQENLTEAAENSCNVAFIQIGESVGAERFYDYVDAFGLFDPTGIELGGEGSSLWWSEDVFEDPDNHSQLAAASFGQTFTVTPLQMIRAVSACVNGGYLMQPYIVKEVTDANGKIVKANEPTVIRQVISEETSETVCDILESVVANGTGSNAYVPGYKIGGKTGTSEHTSYEVATGSKMYTVSFCGFAPTDDPQVVVLLLLDNPQSQTVYVSGGNMGAPTVGGILSEILPYLGVDPVYSAEELEVVDVQMPNVKGSSVESAREKIENAGLSVRVVGDGDTVVDQLPAANATIANGSETVIYAEQPPIHEQVEVPNLYGLTYEDAIYWLDMYGLYGKRASGSISTSSSVVVSKQSVPEGTKVDYGSVVELTLVDTSNLGIY